MLSFQTVQLQLHTSLKNETPTQTYTTISQRQYKNEQKMHTCKCRQRV